ncbi:MAG: flagellar brake domain-containing protein [Mobilitalea sp.]
MLGEVLLVGDKIDVRPLDRAGKPAHTARSFVSQLIDFVDFDVINIAAPMALGKTIVLTVGEYYNLCFYTNKGLYQGNCVVLNNQKDNNILVTLVRITTDLEKLQRRQYYRLECIHEIEYHIISREEEIIQKKFLKNEFADNEECNKLKERLSVLQSEWTKASITDLSGGGAKFNSPSLHEKGDIVQIKLDFISNGELKRLILAADIISSNKLLNQSGAYEYRVEFTDIAQKDREALIKYIFEQERRRRRNDKS